MKALLSLITIISLTGCFQGKDPVKDFPEVKDFVPVYKFEPQFIPELPSHYYLDPKAIYFKAASNNILKQNTSFSIQVRLAGSLVKKQDDSDLGYNWDLILLNPIDQVSLQRIDLTTWKFEGFTGDFEFEQGEAQFITLILEAKVVDQLTDAEKQRLKFYDLTKEINISIVP